MRHIVTEWSAAEDLRPASGGVKPEDINGARVWRQVAYFEWDGVQSYTRLTIVQHGDKTWIDHGRIYPVVFNDEDGA